MLTAILVALGGDGDEPEVIVVDLVGTAVVLFLAHSFSAFLGWRRTSDQTPTFRETVQIVGDQWPVLAAAVVPAAAFGLAAAGAWSSRTAYQISIGYSLGALFLLGASIGRVSGYRRMRTLGTGAIATLIGAFIIGIEAAVTH